jgi:hypothetical protein
VIENEIQYQVTRVAADRFADALAELRQNRAQPDGVHPLLRQAQEDAIRSELEILEAQIRAYEVSRTGSEAVRTAAQRAD